MFCKNCGGAIKSNARFCPHCGKETGIGFWTPAKKAIAIAVISVAAISVATVGAVVLSSPADSLGGKNVGGKGGQGRKGGLEDTIPVNTTEQDDTGTVIATDTYVADTTAVETETVAKTTRKKHTETERTTRKTESVKLDAPTLGEFYDSTDYTPGAGDGVMVTCEWTVVAGADGYEYWLKGIDLNHDDDFDDTEPELERTKEVCYETGASDPVRMKFKVRAYKETSSGTIYSDWSNTISCELNTEGGICRKDVSYDTEPETEEPETKSGGGSSSSQSIKSAYQSVLDEINSHDYQIATYYVWDINEEGGSYKAGDSPYGDGVPELITITGTSEATAEITFYTYSGGKAVKIGEDNGMHADMWLIDDDYLVSVEQFASSDAPSGSEMTITKYIKSGNSIKTEQMYSGDSEENTIDIYYDTQEFYPCDTTDSSLLNIWCN